MNQATHREPNESPSPQGREDLSPASDIEHFDVLIVGAGISGIGGAYHLQQQCPDLRFIVIEAQQSFGGTWLTHRYPGIRSDSDLYTFGYRFKPWVGPPIATADEIRRYMGEVIDENHLAQHIRYRHKITAAHWSSEEGCWLIEGQRLDGDRSFKITANFLWMCQGYYRHAEGYTPHWPGMERFKGQLVHPQTWPEDLNYRGKKVLVIGSGATAATLVPAIANDCAHVTMLQRSPTYFIPGRNQNDIASMLRELKIDERWIHEIVRRKILFDQEHFTQRCRTEPDAVKRELLAAVQALLPAGYDVATHFTPRYRPWQQRIAFVPDGDVFAGIRAGKASVVTDEIDTFTEQGVRLKSGDEITADIIITATGFNLSALGDISFSVDRVPVRLNETVTYRGMMFTGLPNLIWVFGYFRASWTLRADLIADFVCRLLNHMRSKGVQQVNVAIPEDQKNMPLADWLDPDNFNPGYMQRGMHLLPKRGSTHEWQHTQDYWLEREEIPAIDLDDTVFVYRRAVRTGTHQKKPAAQFA